MKNAHFEEEWKRNIISVKWCRIITVSLLVLPGKLHAAVEHKLFFYGWKQRQRHNGDKNKATKSVHTISTSYTEIKRMEYGANERVMRHYTYWAKKTNQKQQQKMKGNAFTHVL